MSKMSEKEQKAYDALPKPPEGSVFVLREVLTQSDPHPYCITPGHVAEASDHFSGMLGEAAIEAAEKKGVRCGVRTCRLPMKEHKSFLVALIDVPDNTVAGINALPGLREYLLSVKEAATAAGIEGFGFPKLPTKKE